MWVCKIIVLGNCMNFLTITENDAMFPFDYLKTAEFAPKIIS